jgi:hypothetical protein
VVTPTLRTHNTFDVDEYIADDLIPESTVRGCVDTLVIAAADSGQALQCTRHPRNSGAILI